MHALVKHELLQFFPKRIAVLGEYLRDSLWRIAEAMKPHTLKRKGDET